LPKKRKNLNQVTDKFKRVKYLRALEKFAKSAINGLKRDDFDETEFRQRVEKNAKVIEKIEAVYLDQPYSKALENFINFVIITGIIHTPLIYIFFQLNLLISFL